MKIFYNLMTASLMLCSAASQAQTNISLVGQDGGTIHLQCTTGSFHTANVGEGVVITIENGTSMLRSGFPDVPKLTEAIIVDDHHQMEVEIVSADYTEYTDVQMVPSKGNLLRTVDPATLAYNYGEAYSTDAFYPGQLASLDEAYVQGQFRAQSIHFYPIQYNALTKVLRVYNHIDVKVNTTENPGINTLPASVPQHTNATMHDVYASRFINYTANAERYEAISEIGDMLVIYDEEYIEELQPWIQWKKEKGIQVHLMDVATINTVAAINNYVEDFYNENGLTYLMLVGDEDQVPSLLVNNSGGQGYCDPCFGYISGNDSYAEVFVGRFLVHTDSELPAVINKVLEYEMDPDVSKDWFSIAMGIGSNEGEGFGDDGQADWQHQNGMKEELLDYTYTEVYERYDGNHTSASPTGGSTADGSGDPSNTTLTAVIDEGCSLINYTGHGAHNLIVTGSYTNTQINQLDNHGYYPFFIIVGCCVGDFDDDDASGDTFGEAWLKCPSANYDAPTGGIGGSFSSVYQSWAPPMEGQDEMNKVICATSQAGNTRHTLGSIHYHGCHGMNDEYDDEGDEMTDTWILMGDPTVQLRTAFPDAIIATHVSSAFLGVNQMTVNCDTEEAMVALTFDGEIIATGIVDGGMVNLTFAAQTVPGEILVTITSFNTIPYQGTVQLVPANGPYVLNESVLVDDASGNNNSEVDYNESILLDITAGNIGIETAFGVTGVLTCGNSAVVIADDEEDFGNIGADGNVSVEDAFAFYINGFIADQTVVLFTITYTDVNGNTWTSTFTVTVNAPNIVCTDSALITDADGNNNGRLDSGETADITFTVTNSGHAPTAIVLTAVLDENSTYVTCPQPVIDLGVVAAGETVEATFTVVVASGTPASEDVLFHFTTSSDFYGSDCEIAKTMNQVVEDWESGTTTTFNWTYEDDADWFSTSLLPYEGDYCMQSGNITEGETTTLKITIQVIEAGQIGFSYRVSSEASYDFLQFRIGNTTMGEWSGDVPWSEASYTIGTGTKVLRWRYDKDPWVSSGSDAAWVDNIIFPPMAPVSVEEILPGEVDMDIYPNPAQDVATIEYWNNHAGMVEVSVTDITGAVVMKNGVNASSGEQRMTIETGQWAAGVYLVNVKTNTGNSTLKLIVE
ncbi:MAG: C25 family cysteine peptidase [Flavobacteriales bacterium]